MAIGKGTAGAYKCPKCGYEYCFYDEEFSGCHSCGHKQLEFWSFGYPDTSISHWTLIDCETSKTISERVVNTWKP